MTRFEQEISGKLGDYWKTSAQKELDDIRKDLLEGRITIDAQGIARNCIGRVLMSDILEKVLYVTDGVNAEATMKAREEEVEKELEEYRRNIHEPSMEEKAEMRAAFGSGTPVINIITGQRYVL